MDVVLISIWNLGKHYRTTSGVFHLLSLMSVTECMFYSAISDGNSRII